MSRTSLYCVFKTKVWLVSEYHNSHLSAPVLWDYLCKTYLDPDCHWLMLKDCSKLWALWKNLTIPKSIRAAHLFTFDGAIIPFTNKDEIGNLFKEAHSILRLAQPDFGSHWEAIGEDLLKQTKYDKRMIGFGLGCTSVCDPWEYWSYPRNKEFVEKIFSISRSLSWCEQAEEVKS